MVLWLVLGPSGMGGRLVHALWGKDLGNPGRSLCLALCDSDRLGWQAEGEAGCRDVSGNNKLHFY